MTATGKLGWTVLHLEILQVGLEANVMIGGLGDLGLAEPLAEHVARVAGAAAGAVVRGADVKHHLASLFLNENINLGKKYVFDIKRISKDEYDRARRALYNAGVVDLVLSSDPSPPNSPLKSSESSMSCGSCQQTRALQEKLRKLKEAMLCVLCCEEVQREEKISERHERKDAEEKMQRGIIIYIIFITISAIIK
ncbi:hypothetical protein EI555_006702, partial [Monodon monoceros]